MFSYYATGVTSLVTTVCKLAPQTQGVADPSSLQM